MRSIKARFNNISRRNPNLSSYICFTEIIKGQNFSKRRIALGFNELVDKEDYNKGDKKELLHQLYLCSNKAEEGIK